MRDPSSLDTILYAKVLGSGGGGSSDAVLYTPQTLTGEQKAQARANIGAADASTSIPDDVKVALLNCFEHVAWTDDQGQTYYDALEAALYPLDHITAVYVQSGTVYDTDSLDSLKTDLTVTAYYEGGNTATVAAANYTLSGTLTAGTSTITVTYGGKTTTFDVTVTPVVPAEYQRVEYIESSGTQRIDTGIYPAENSKLVCKMQTADSSATQLFGIGYITSGSRNNSRVLFYEGSGTVSAQIGIGTGNNNAGRAELLNPNDFAIHTMTIDIANLRAQLNDNTPVAFANPAFAYQNVATLQLFAQYSNSDYVGKKLKVFDFKYYEAGLLVKHLLPCYRKADGVIGMYDVANNAFLTNAGSGTFIKGADV